MENYIGLILDERNDHYTIGIFPVVRQSKKSKPVGPGINRL